MTLYEIINILKKIALTQPNIRSASDGSVYDKMNTNPSVQYDVVHIQQTTHQEDFETDYFGLQLFYISRLEDSLEDNRLQIQSIGKEILGNIIRTFCENFSIDYPTITYIPFTQKFADLTAGVYCNIRLEVPKDIICADDYIAEVVPGKGIKLQDIGITITENGLRVITADAEYDGIGEIRIETNVPQTAAELQYKEVEYTENGEYSVRPDPAYDGLTEVAVTVDVPDRYDEGYDDGKEDGAAEQKAKLVPTAVTENGTYSREDGFSQIVVSVPDRYDEGYDDGYDAGFAAGAAACSGLQISSITLNVASAITDNGTATTTYSPSTAYTDIYYTSSDPSKATINENTGAITVIAAGTVTICARDRMSGLRDCKQVAVRKAAGTESVLDFVYRTTGANQTVWLFSGDAQDDNSFFNQFYNGIISLEIDGVYVSKSPTNIFSGTVYSYRHTFPTAGDHNVKYHMTREVTDFRSPGYYLGHIIFNDNLDHTHLISANVGSGYKNLYNGVFQGCDELTAVTLPNTVTDLGPYTFEYSAIQRLTIPDSVTGITVISPGTEIETEGLFNHCEQLTGVTFGTGIRSIPRYTFRGCAALRNVEMRRATPPTISEHLFDDCPNLAHIYVPASAVNAYKTATGWSAYANKISASS